MKKILSIILTVCMLFSIFTLTGCSDKNEEELFYKPYTALTYTDFNNIVSEYGYTPIENTDNTYFEFDHSFYITEEETGMSLMFFEAESPEMCYKYFNQLVLAYENFTANYATMIRYQNIGRYVLVDEHVILYIAFVDNTILASVSYIQDLNNTSVVAAELEKLITALEYPEFQYYEKGE